MLVAAVGPPGRNGLEESTQLEGCRGTNMELVVQCIRPPPSEGAHQSSRSLRQHTASRWHDCLLEELATNWIAHHGSIDPYSSKSRKSSINNSNIASSLAFFCKTSFAERVLGGILNHSGSSRSRACGGQVAEPDTGRWHCRILS